MHGLGSACDWVPAVYPPRGAVSAGGSTRCHKLYVFKWQLAEWTRAAASGSKNALLPPGCLLVDSRAWACGPGARVDQLDLGFILEVVDFDTGGEGRCFAVIAERLETEFGEAIAAAFEDVQPRP